MLTDAKILITGASGQIGSALVEALAPHNEIWGVARFTRTEARDRLEELGVVTRSIDLVEARFDQLPDDFTHVIHLAAYMGAGGDDDHALRVNAEATGLLLHHCRRARSALVMSTFSVYRPHDDPTHVYGETDRLGDANAPHSPTYSMSKIAQEAVARTVGRLVDLPLTIARMNVAYGDHGGLPAHHLRAVLADQPVVTRWDPCTYSPIHTDDIAEQLPALLDAASVPATVVNWCGDEPVSVQEWTAYVAQLTGRTPRVTVVPQSGTQRSAIGDITRRMAITGACRVDWRAGFARMVEARREQRAT